MQAIQQRDHPPGGSSARRRRRPRHGRRPHCPPRSAGPGPPPPAPVQRSRRSSGPRRPAPSTAAVARWAAISTDVTQAATVAASSRAGTTTTIRSSPATGPPRDLTPTLPPEPPRPRGRDQDVEQEVLLLVPHQDVQARKTAQGAVHLVARQRVPLDEVPPVARDEDTVRRQAPPQPVHEDGQVVGVAVVGDLGQHDEVERARGVLLRTRATRVSTRSPAPAASSRCRARSSAEAATSTASRRSVRAASSTVSTPVLQPISRPTGTQAGAGPRASGHACVPRTTVLETPRVFPVRSVELLEELRPQAGRGGGVTRAQEELRPALEVRQHPRRSSTSSPGRADSGAVCDACRAMATDLRRRATSSRSRRVPRCHGTRTSPGRAQCHNHTG